MWGAVDYSSSPQSVPNPTITLSNSEVSFAKEGLPLWGANHSTLGWYLWLDRNSIIFKDEEVHLEEVWNRVKFRIA